MRRSCSLLLISFVVLLLAACEKPREITDPVSQQLKAVKILTYDEREAGTDTYILRVLVSPDFLRLDDGYAESDFALLERRSGTIFSVSHEDHSILVIKNQPGDAALPAELVLAESHAVDDESPAVAGKQPVHSQYLASGTLCYQALTIPGLMDDVVAAMAEYAEVLARRQLNNMQTVPASMQTPCFLSRYVYAPARHFRQGLPVQEWDDTGFSRTLTDFSEDETVPAALFELPGTYERFSPGK